MKKKFLLFLLVTIISFSLYAGPFGLEKGMNFDQIKETCGGREPIKIDEGRYYITPLKPHPYFIKYVIWVDSIEGLNYIKAIGTDISTNGYGFEVRNKYDSLEISLSKTYGDCDRTSLLLPGSLWDEAEDWMMSLEKKERYHYSTWKTKYGSTLPDSITGIYLYANANNKYSGYISLEYEFSNHEKVNNAQKEIEDSVF